MLQPIFDEAADKVAAEFPTPGKVVLAKVDCDKESKYLFINLCVVIMRLPINFSLFFSQPPLEPVSTFPSTQHSRLWGMVSYLRRNTVARGQLKPLPLSFASSSLIRLKNTVPFSIWTNWTTKNVTPLATLIRKSRVLVIYYFFHFFRKCQLPRRKRNDVCKSSAALGQ